MKEPALFRRAVFRATLQALGAMPKHDLFDALDDAYGQSARHYHTQRHIAECLAQFRRHRALAARPDEIEIALWFHDAVYDTHRRDNEENSARWACAYLTSEGIDPDAVKRITALILATKTHQTDDPDAALLVDIDLAILGAPHDVFERYDQAIRREYAWLPEAQYRSGRTGVLSTFFERSTIFSTPALRHLYEKRARENIKRKLADLGNQA